MMKESRSIVFGCMITLFLFLFSVTLFADKTETVEINENTIHFSKDTIFVDMAQPHPLTGARVVVNQSPAIAYLALMPNRADMREVKGFRIQIFSSNKGEVARTNAFKIEKELLKKNPQLPVYVIYESPFWKVRVGNCITHTLAQDLRLWVMEEYPDYQTETYIVPSQIIY